MMKKTYQMNARDPQYAQLLGGAILIWLEKMEDECLSPEMSMTNYLEHGEDENLVWEITISRLPKSHPDVQHVIPTLELLGRKP